MLLLHLLMMQRKKPQMEKSLMRLNFKFSNSLLKSSQLKLQPLKKNMITQKNKKNMLNKLLWLVTFLNSLTEVLLRIQKLMLLLIKFNQMLKSLHGQKTIMYQKKKLKKLLQPAILKPSLKLMSLKNLHTDSFNKKMNMRMLLFVKPKDKKSKNIMEVIQFHQYMYPNIMKKLFLVMIHQHGDPHKKMAL
jgi:hypothetical protein